jgi:hypothetical protein
MLLAQALRTKIENAYILLPFAQILLLAGLVGLRSFAVNWSRVAFAWPEVPKQTPFWVRPKTSLHRIFSGLADPLGLLRQAAVAVPAVLAAIATIAGLFWVHPVLGLAGLYFVPILPFALIVSLGWPRSSSLAVDDSPLPVQDTRAIAKGTFRFRLIAYLWVCAPTWWIVASIFALPRVLPSAQPIIPYLLVSAWLPCLTLAAAWLCGAGALLYARFRSSSTATVFD